MLVKSKKAAEKIVRDLPSAASNEEVAIPDPVFLPPEVVAAQENDTENVTAIPLPPKKASWWKRTPKKKKLLILIPSAVVVLILIGLAVYLLVIKKAKPVVPVVVKHPLFRDLRSQRSSSRSPARRAAFQRVSRLAISPRTC